MPPVVRPNQNTLVTSVAADVSCLFSSPELRTGGPPVGTWSDEDETRRHAAGRPGLDLKLGPLQSGSVTHPILNFAELASSHLSCVQGSRRDAEWFPGFLRRDVSGTREKVPQCEIESVLRACIGPFTMKGEEFVTYTTVSHQGAIRTYFCVSVCECVSLLLEILHVGLLSLTY